MKPVFKVLLMAVAYLAIFILGACSGAIHPACYAYIGALLPLVTALVYRNTTSIIKGFGAATALNGFIFVPFALSSRPPTGGATRKAPWTLQWKKCALAMTS